MGKRILCVVFVVFHSHSAPQVLEFFSNSGSWRLLVGATANVLVLLVLWFGLSCFSFSQMCFIVLPKFLLHQLCRLFSRRLGHLKSAVLKVRMNFFLFLSGMFIEFYCFSLGNMKEKNKTKQKISAWHWCVQSLWAFINIHSARITIQLRWAHSTVEFAEVVSMVSQEKELPALRQQRSWKNKSMESKFSKSVLQGVLMNFWVGK